MQVHAAPDTLPAIREQAAPPSKAAAVSVRAGTGKSENTIRAYGSALRGFVDWCEAAGLDPLPASPDTVALYIEARALAGKSGAALRLDVAAIKHAHKEARKARRATGSDPEAFADPTENEDVADTLRAHAKRARRERPARQAEPLNLEALAAITATACRPRATKDGRTEHPEQARYRGMQDIALIRVMRDALLRREEASRLTWKDIYTNKDGTATISLQGRKTTDGVFTGYLTRRTVKILFDELYPPAAKRGDMDASDRPVFLSSRVDYGTGRARMRPLSPASISNRIAAAAKHAGLAGRYTGHSPRIGMAVDLAGEGASLVEIQVAGGWKSADMPAYYCRNQQAGENAVARRMGDK